MEEEFLRKYYSVGKTTSIRKDIREFTQGTSQTFHEAWEQLRDLTREYPHHEVSNHELKQIFYDGLGPKDRYLIDTASGSTFMSKYEDDAMDLIETVAENSHHNAAKPFGRGEMPKIIDAKSAETGMLLERIDKMVEVQNLLLDRLNIRNGSEGLAPVSLQEALSCINCSRFDHIELDCPVMAIQGQNMYRQGPSGGPTQQGRQNFPGTYPNYYNTPVFNNPRRMQDIGGTTIKPILHNSMVSSNKNLTLIKDSRRSSCQLNRKPSCKPHARPRRHLTRSSVQSRN